MVNIELSPLSPADSAKLAGALLGQPKGTNEGPSNKIARASAGNAFLIHELARWQEPDQEARAIEHPDSDFETPLAAAINRRISTLSETATALLDVIAVAGEALPDDIVSIASGVGVGYARAREELLDLRVARAFNRGTHTDLDIYHALQRDVVERLRCLDAAEIHGRIASAFMKIGDDPQRVYSHLRRTKTIHRCAEYAERAGDKAFGNLAFEQAATLYESALGYTMLENQRKALYKRLADSLASAGLGAKSAEAYRMAATIEGQEGMEWKLSMRVLAAGQLLYCGLLDAGLSEFRQVCRQAGVPYPKTKLMLYISIVWLRLRLRARGLILGDFRDLSARRKIQLDICWTGPIGTSMMETTRSAAYSARYLWWALRAGVRRGSCRALAAEAAITSAAPLLGLSPDFLLKRSKELNAQLPNLSEDAFIACMEAIVACNRGEWKTSAEKGEEALRRYIQSGTGAGWERVTAATYWLSARIMTGDWKGVIATMPALILDANSRGDRYAAVNLQLLSNFFLAEIGAGRARETAQRVERLHHMWGQRGFDMQRFCADMARIECELYEGAAAEAWARFRKSQTQMRNSELQQIEVLRVRLAYAGARCAIAFAMNVSAKRKRKLLQTARAHSDWRGERRKYGKGLGALMRAGILSLEGDRYEAERWLRISLKYSNDAGMKPIFAVCQARLAGDSAASPWFAEQEIANKHRLLDTLAPGSWW